MAQAAIPSDVQDIVDNPREQLHVDLKAWIDIADDVARAKLARHLAALANHGGGYLLIGFDNNGTPSSARPADLSIYNQDAITGIIDRYLEPTFQCEVFEASQTGSTPAYLVVRIPSHRSVPIFSKRDGPHDSKGLPQGIVSARCYIRMPGPKSTAIATPEQWRELIHRCVVNERESLLQSIGKLLREPVQQRAQRQLIEWHARMHAAYIGAVQTVARGWPVSIRDNHYQLTYAISVAGMPVPLKLSDLQDVIRRAGDAVRTTINTGWSMFYQFSGPLAPHVVLDDATGEQIDALEANLLSKGNITNGLPDFWRIVADGRATIVRPYREDRSPVEHLVKRGVHPGMWLSPNHSIREVYEMVLHAKELAKAFPDAVSVEFCCTWYGLSDRRAMEFNADAYEPLRICHEPGRTTKGTFAIERLSADTASVVVELVGPMLRLFNGLEINREWVEHIRPTWLRL